MNTCLIVSPHFPPSTLAGVHRARHLAKHLPAHGWHPVVVCVDEAFHEERLDPALAALVPRAAEVVKVSAFPAECTRPFGLGEISLRAWRPLRAAVRGLVADRRPKVVMITGSPYYPMLMAAEIQRLGAPVVLDFQDPWVSAWGATQPWLTKAGISHRLAVLLEPRAVAAADFITAVSETQNKEMRERYPWLSSERMAAIPIGGDPDDYVALAEQQSMDRVDLDTTRFNLSYVGTIWPQVLSTIRALLGAVSEVRVRRPEVFARLRLNFIGTTANPDASDGLWVHPLAEAAGVADIVREEPRRLPYLEALSLQARSDAILMMGSVEPHYTASKIYGVMMSGRPYLSVFHQASSSHTILTRAGGGIALGFDGAAALPRLIDRIADAIIRLATAPDTVVPAHPAAYRDFTAARIAERYAEIFDKLSGC